MKEINTASRDWAISNAWRMKHFRGPKATVPTGQEVDASAYVDVMPPGGDERGVLDQPEKYLKHPKPGHAYLWRPRQDDDTIRMCELQYIRPVLWGDLKPELGTISLYAFDDSGIPDEKGERKKQTYVGWKKFALFEVGPELAYRWFKQPEDYHLRLVTRLPEDFQEQLEPMGTTRMEIKDKRSAEQEAILDRTRRR